MGDTVCSQQILDGTYEYPLDTDIWTKKILQEAHHSFFADVWDRNLNFSYDGGFSILLAASGRAKIVIL
jgi:hypothetical protein